MRSTTSDGGRAVGADAQHDPDWRVETTAPRLARALIVTVLILFSLIAVLGVVDRGAWPLVPLVIVLYAAMLGLQLGYFARTQPYGRWRYPALAAQALLSLVPLLFLGQPWIGVPGFLGGSLLLALPRRVGAIAAAGVVVVVVVAQSRFTPGSLISVVYSGVSAVITSLVVFGLTRLAQLVVELERTRADLARMEVTRERLRIAQDLHDLLGSSLTAITLRAELARAHLRAADGLTGAADELDSVTRLSRQALSDVRHVSAGPLRTSPDEEIDQAVALLRTAGFTTRTDIDRNAVSVLAPEPQAVMATALREGATNVLRHGGGHDCTIRLHRIDGRVVLQIHNDLPAGAPAADADGGQGLTNLANRLATVEGRLNVGAVGQHSWHLDASVPAERTVRRVEGSS